VLPCADYTSVLLQVGDNSSVGEGTQERVLRNRVPSVVPSVKAFQSLGLRTWFGRDIHSPALLARLIPFALLCLWRELNMSSCAYCITVSLAMYHFWRAIALPVRRSGTEHAAVKADDIHLPSSAVPLSAGGELASSNDHSLYEAYVRAQEMT
jgi:hypothetical protein